jgi:hypothetical protein
MQKMLNFAKFLPCSAPVARLQPQCLYERRAVMNFATVSLQEHGKGRLFSVGRSPFAAYEGEKNESVGRIERRPENALHVQNYAKSLVDQWQVEQDCEDEIFSSIGK